MNLLLLGGGLDSTTLLALLKQRSYQVDALHVNYGQKAYKGELASCKYFCKKYGVKLWEGSMDLSLFSSAAILKKTRMGKTRKSNCLELRNVALVGYASVLCASNGGGGTIYLGFHQEKDNTFLDATTPWLEDMENALLKSTRSLVKIATPLKNFTRDEIIGNALQLDEEILTKSYTCYEAPVRGKECGKCIHCIAKKRMLKELL